MDTTTDTTKAGAGTTDTTTGHHEGWRRHDAHEELKYSDRPPELGVDSQEHSGFWRIPLSPQGEERMTRIIGCAIPVRNALAP